jgi:hypothetical protein
MAQDHPPISGYCGKAAAFVVAADNFLASLEIQQVSPPGLTWRLMKISVVITIEGVVALYLLLNIVGAMR